MMAYCSTHLFLDRRLGGAKFTIYVLAAVLSAVVILFSGSRTGAVACAAGMGYVGLKALRLIRHARIGRITVFAAIGGGIALYFLVPALVTVSERMETGIGGDSFQARVRSQTETVKYVLSHAQASLIGMGHDPAKFHARVGLLSHTHSEYVQVLWNSGVPGLLLYLLFMYRLYVGLRSRAGPQPDVMGIAAQAMLFVGLVVGLTIGNLMITGDRLAAYGMMTMFVFGHVYGRSRAKEVDPIPLAEGRYGSVRNGRP